MIRVENICKAYKRNQVLSNIHLEFKPGRVYGVVGKNGAGKTSLFRCIAGLENYEGSIFYEHGKLKDTLGFLPTEPYFFSKITGREYLQLVCRARAVTYASFDDHNIFELPLDRYADDYSSGMKKKLALTGVLLQKNQVFILDEPFNGVDIESNILINEIIAQLKALDKIVILSSHIFSTLQDSCDFLYLLDNGTIAEAVGKEEFYKIEALLSGSGIGDRIARLNLT